MFADISGFDEYLSHVELEHAVDVLRELLNLLVELLTPPLHMSSIDGDAIFAYAPEPLSIEGPDLLALIDHTYLTFRQRLASIRRNSTCNCRACSAVPNLDLKFFIHHAEYGESASNGQPLLTGLGPTLLRERLLKNNILDGSRAYALITSTAADALHLNLRNTAAQTHSYPDFGVIRTHYIDLAARLPELEEKARVRVTPADAMVCIRQDYAQDVDLIWDWLNDPHKRTRWMIARTWTAGLRPGGRHAAGATNHCAHGFGSLLETILDWQPNHTFTTATRQPEMAVDFLTTSELTPLPDSGTRLSLFMRSGPAGSPWLDNALLRRGLVLLFTHDYRRLANTIRD